MGGVKTSDGSSSDFSLSSTVEVGGVFGDDEAFIGLTSASDIAAILSHVRVVSGEMVISDASRECADRLCIMIS